MSENVTTAINITNTTDYDECQEQGEHSNIRLALLGTGSIIAFIGIMKNVALIWMFIKLSKVWKYSQIKWVNGRFTTTRLYMTYLAFADAMICASYVNLYGTESSSLFFRIPWIFKLYNRHLVAIYYVGKTVQLIIPWLIILATSERFLIITTNRRLRTFKKVMTNDWVRVILASSIVVFCCLIMHNQLFKFGTTILPDGTCDDPFEEVNFYQVYQPILPAKFVNMYDVVIVGLFLSVVIPFIILISLNLLIIMKLKQEISHTREASAITVHDAATQGQPRDQNEDAADSGDAHQVTVKLISTDNNGLSTLHDGANGLVVTQGCEPDKEADCNVSSVMLPLRRGLSTRRKTRVRETTITMIVVVTSYILCNTPGLVLTVLENFYNHLLTEENGEDTTFYKYYSDTQSILFMFCSFLRLTIYMACNHEFRQQFCSLFRFCHRCNPQRNENHDIAQQEHVHYNEQGQSVQQRYGPGQEGSSAQFVSLQVDKNNQSVNVSVK